MTINPFACTRPLPDGASSDSTLALAGTLIRTCGLALLVCFSAHAALAEGLPPEEALSRMKVADGLEVKLFAHEPEIRQPVAMNFDERGRMWVIQYIQYPNPAGLKAVSVDQYLRTKYDRVPEPPPKGPKGLDKITILEDTDGDGRADQVKDFVTGLNLATALALGHGGVFVVQAPYLLFYPDRNQDDVPDGDPEVLLTGFGMEDAHAFANSMQWGPDGWLYGAQGSTVTARIRGIEFQQGIWRYHPLTKEFELFAEGGGNTWGLDFDRHGNVIAGTNYGNVVLLHQVQGGYYVKGFSKHGPLHNPYTFGYFEHAPHKGAKGGHVTIGGVVYQGGAFPEKFNDKYIGGNVLSNAVYWHAMQSKGSTFSTQHEGELLTSDDERFRPVDCLTGPDGSVYVADWYDKRANHVIPIDDWEKTTGRIYKIQAKNAKPLAPFNLSKLSSPELVKLLSHANDWQRREARVLLAERRDPAVAATLRDLLLKREDNPLVLQALWGLFVSGGFNDELAAQLLAHPHPDVRSWTVRLLGDARKLSPAVQQAIVELARTEPQASVRSQMASTSKRLPAEQGLPIVAQLLHRSEDVDDPYIPLLLWWSIESRSVSDRDRVLDLFQSSEFWKEPLVSRHIVERLARRYAAEGGDADFAACARLLQQAAGSAESDLLIKGMEQGLVGRRLVRIPAPLEKPLADLWLKNSTNLTLLRFALRLGSEPASKRALELITSGDTPPPERTALIEIVGQVGPPETAATLQQLVRAPHPVPIRMAALAALQRFSDPSIVSLLLDDYGQMPPEMRARARDVLVSRLPWSVLLVEAVKGGKIKPEEVPLDQVRRMVTHDDKALTATMEKLWGRIQKETPQEKLSKISEVGILVRETGVNGLRGTPDPVGGKAVFTKVCAVCHTLFGEGNKVGPDLTGADRKNTPLMLLSIIDPSGAMRAEYVAYTVATVDGRVLTGLMAESTPQTVTLLDDKNKRTVVPRSDIEEIKESPVSLMPEKILDPLSPKEIRDLWAYLRSPGPVAAPAATTADAAPAASPASGKTGPLKVCLISGSPEYESEKSLTALQQILEQRFGARCTLVKAAGSADLPGLEALDDADVALFFMRRLTIDGPQLDHIKKYVEAGRPVVAVRTASHGLQKWLEFDKLVLGGNYHGHVGQNQPMVATVVPRARMHPVLEGVADTITSRYGIYQTGPLAADAELLMTGSMSEMKGTHPVTWVREYKGGRVFYTSLGGKDDFDTPGFRRLLTNALFWAARRELPQEKVSIKP